jgi:hypothetical protein
VAETAHFFWHGPPLSGYERACLASFREHGFRVVLWSYAGVQAPIGIERADAREVLPEAHLGRWNQAGVPGSLPAFSNAFRYQLLADHDGWWFDTDNLCLRPVEDFAAIPVDRFLACRQTDGQTGCGVLKAPDRTVPTLCTEELTRRGTVVGWGDLGPKLVQAVMAEEGIEPVPPAYFYAVSYEQGDLALRPDRADEVAEACRDSYSYHYWHEIIRRWQIPKDVMPPRDSFLHRKFVAALPGLAARPTLPVEVLDAQMAANPQTF